MVFIKRIKRGKYTYLAEVKSVRNGNKVRHEFIRYVGREVDKKTILSGSLASASVEKVALYGPLLVLHDIAYQLGLAEILGAEAPYILSLVYAHCIEPGSLTSIEEWYKRTDLDKILSINHVTYDKLLKALDSLQKEPDYIQSKMFTAAKKLLTTNPKGIFYDVTNVYFYGYNCPMAKKGHNKDNKNEKQVQIGLAVTKDEKIPIFHQTFDGNIHDAKTLGDIFYRFDSFLIKHACIVWDRGISSKENILEAQRQKFDVICGLAMHDDLKRIVEAIMKKGIIACFENRIELKNSTLFATQQKYSFKGINGYLNICYNDEKKTAIKEARYKKIQQAIDALKKGKPISDGVAKYLRYGKVVNAAVEAAEKFDGISLIFSTKKIPKEEAIAIYFEKDVVEKSFRCMKSTLEIRPIRHWLSERVKAHIFLCYIAYYLLSILEYKLKPLKMSASHAINQLKTAYRVYLSDKKTKNKFVKTVTLSKEQESILKAVNKQLLKCSQ